MIFGCLRRLGCLFVVLIAVAAYFTRAWWWTPARVAIDRSTGVVAATDTTTSWERLTPAAAEKGERQVRALAAPRGPVYASLRAGELASYAFLSLSSALPPFARDAEATVVGDRVYVRSVVSPRDFAGVLGSLGSVLPERDTLRLGGTFDVLDKGRAQFHIVDVQLGRMALPERMIPALVRRVRRGAVAPDVANDALEVPLPPYIGDVRIARGRITLYKTTR